jgi:DNA polymerase III subunit epsilon
VNLDFAVIDVETTGLFPGGHDRIVEIAIVRTTTSGNTVAQYSTLINPNRDVGPTSIHGITARDIINAPGFAEIAGDIADQISEAVLVGHNVEFDVRFLASEFSRIGVNLPDVSRACTLMLSGYLRPSPVNGRLASCCAACGIPYGPAHLASGDAAATARLLHHVGMTEGWSAIEAMVYHGELIARRSIQNLNRSGKVLTRQAAQVVKEEADTYLSRLSANLQLAPSPLGSERESKAVRYLNVLDRALEDRYISAGEAEALMALAQDWGMDRAAVTDAHERYLNALARAAVADGVVTEAERQDLLLVATLLGLSEEALNAALDQARAGGASQAALSTESLAGKTVCFTGELRCEFDGRPITREIAESLAEAAGLIAKGGVSRKLDILVTADPLTLSGKGRKAREYGTRVIAESVFWQMIGLAVD